MEEHKAHLGEQIGYLGFQPLRSQQHSISLMAEELLIHQADTIRKRLGLGELAIRQVLEHALVQGIEIIEWRLTRHPDCDQCKKDLAMYIQTRNMVWHPSA